MLVQNRRSDLERLVARVQRGEWPAAGDAPLAAAAAALVGMSLLPSEDLGELCGHLGRAEVHAFLDMSGALDGVEPWEVLLTVLRWASSQDEEGKADAN
ncbi:MAG: hypothetical protein D6781_01545 [Verrucomicrobia bacterium]|nr:MAG: hypothetical protein D6781_01545 [Verrucomicrobiota bacterium]